MVFLCSIHVYRACILVCTYLKIDALYIDMLHLICFIVLNRDSGLIFRIMDDEQKPRCVGESRVRWILLVTMRGLELGHEGRKNEMQLASRYVGIVQDYGIEQEISKASIQYI